MTKDEMFAEAKRLAKEGLGREDIAVRLPDLPMRCVRTAVFGKKHAERLMTRELLRRRA